MGQQARSADESQWRYAFRLIQSPAFHQPMALYLRYTALQPAPSQAGERIRGFPRLRNRTVPTGGHRGGGSHQGFRISSIRLLTPVGTWSADLGPGDNALVVGPEVLQSRTRFPAQPGGPNRFAAAHLSPITLGISRMITARDDGTLIPISSRSHSPTAPTIQTDLRVVKPLTARALRRNIPLLTATTPTKQLVLILWQLGKWVAIPLTIQPSPQFSLLSRRQQQQLLPVHHQRPQSQPPRTATFEDHRAAALIAQDFGAANRGSARLPAHLGAVADPFWTPPNPTGPDPNGQPWPEFDPTAFLPDQPLYENNNDITDYQILDVPSENSPTTSPLAPTAANGFDSDPFPFSPADLEDHRLAKPLLQLNHNQIAPDHHHTDKLAAMFDTSLDHVDEDRVPFGPASAADATAAAATATGLLPPDLVPRFVTTFPCKRYYPMAALFELSNNTDSAPEFWSYQYPDQCTILDCALEDIAPHPCGFETEAFRTSQRHVGRTVTIREIWSECCTLLSSPMNPTHVPSIAFVFEQHDWTLYTSTNPLGSAQHNSSGIDNLLDPIQATLAQSALAQADLKTIFKLLKAAHRLYSDALRDFKPGPTGAAGVDPATLNVLRLKELIARLQQIIRLNHQLQIQVGPCDAQRIKDSILSQIVTRSGPGSINIVTTPHENTKIAQVLYPLQCRSDLDCGVSERMTHPDSETSVPIVGFDLDVPPALVKETEPASSFAPLQDQFPGFSYPHINLFALARAKPLHRLPLARQPFRAAAVHAKLTLYTAELIATLTEGLLPDKHGVLAAAHIDSVALVRSPTLMAQPADRASHEPCLDYFNTQYFLNTLRYHSIFALSRHFLLQDTTVAMTSAATMPGAGLSGLLTAALPPDGTTACPLNSHPELGVDPPPTDQISGNDSTTQLPRSDLLDNSVVANLSQHYSLFQSFRLYTTQLEPHFTDQQVTMDDIKAQTGAGALLNSIPVQQRPDGGESSSSSRIIKREPPLTAKTENPRSDDRNHLPSVDEQINAMLNEPPFDAYPDEIKAKIRVDLAQLRRARAEKFDRQRRLEHQQLQRQQTDWGPGGSRANQSNQPQVFKAALSKSFGLNYNHYDDFEYDDMVWNFDKENLREHLRLKRLNADRAGSMMDFNTNFLVQHNQTLFQLWRLFEQLNVKHEQLLAALIMLTCSPEERAIRTIAQYDR